MSRQCAPIARGRTHQVEEFLQRKREAMLNKVRAEGQLVCNVTASWINFLSVKLLIKLSISSEQHLLYTVLKPKTRQVEIMLNVLKVMYLFAYSNIPMALCIVKGLLASPKLSISLILTLCIA